MHIICSQCNNAKYLTQFSKDRSRKTGHRSVCKICCATRFKLYRNKHKERLDAYHRAYMQVYKLKEYDISKTQYETLLLKQDNRCAICNKTETVKQSKNGPVRHLAIDHDHISGKVRGLLCYVCNTTLGRINEDTSILENMIQYLRNHEKCQ